MCTTKTSSYCEGGPNNFMAWKRGWDGAGQAGLIKRRDLTAGNHNVMLELPTTYGMAN